MRVLLLSLIFIWHYILNVDRFAFGDETFSRERIRNHFNEEHLTKDAVISVVPSLQNTTAASSTAFQFKDATNNNNRSSSSSISFISVSQLELINLWKKFPLSITANVSGLSEKCQRGTGRFLNAIQNHELWALKMLDATAKMPSGILSGNVNQFGDYDECLSVDQAQYCLAEVDLGHVRNNDYLLYRDLIHSHFPFRGDFNTPQHRIPDFSIIKWGLCIPSECTNEDLRLSLEENFGVTAVIRPSLCRQAKPSPSAWSFGDYFARLFFTFLLLALTISSLAVHYKVSVFTGSESMLVKLLLAFSLQNSWKELTNTNIRKCDDNNNSKATANGSEEIRAVHGIRALSAIALLLFHRSGALLFIPFINRTHTIQNLGMAWTVIARTAIVYTDSFILLSGLLTANAMLKDLERHGSLRFLDKLVTRVFRILPNIVALILFCTYILPNLNSGPLWPTVIEHHSKLCKQYMWRNFLFIHNHFNFENMCLTHTHQVGIDMQLFLATPFLIYAWWHSNKLGIYMGAIIVILSTILRFWITMQNNLSHMIYFGISIKQMFDTANLSYIRPTHRASIYVMGVVLAYILRKHCCNFNKFQATLCWIVALSLGAIAVLGPFHMARLNYVYSNIDAAVFGAFSPLWWGFALAWVIYASNRGYAGWFGDLLSWDGFRSFTKIAYAFYLVQFPVIFYNVGIQKNSDEFKPSLLIHLIETAVIVLLSIILTLFVEIPFQNVKKVLFNGDKKNQSPHIKIEQNNNHLKNN